MIRSLIILLIYSVTYQPLLSAEVTYNDSIADDDYSICSEDIKKNKEILKKCHQSWEDWGIEKPNPRDLRSINECSSMTASGKDLLYGCSAAVTAPLIFFGSVGALGLGSLSNIGRVKTDEYIFKYGSRDDIEQRKVENKLIAICGLGAVPSRRQDFMEIECRTDGSASPIHRRECNAALEKMRKQIACARQPETRKKIRAELRIGHDKVIASLADEVYKERKWEERKRQRREKFKKKVVNDCQVHINPYRRNLMQTFSAASLTQEIIHRFKPSQKSISDYNNCVKNHPDVSESILKDLISDGSGWLDDILANYEAMACYNRRVRQEIYCEVALAAMSGGVLASQALARRGVNRFLGLPHLKHASNKLSKTQRRKASTNPTSNSRKTSNTPASLSDAAISLSKGGAGSVGVARKASGLMRMGDIRDRVESILMNPRINRKVFKLDPRYTLCAANVLNESASWTFTLLDLTPYVYENLRRGVGGAITVTKGRSLIFFLDEDEHSDFRHRLENQANTVIAINHPKSERVMNKSLIEEVNSESSDLTLYRKINDRYMLVEPQNSKTIQCYEKMKQIADRSGKVHKPERIQEVLNIERLN